MQRFNITEGEQQLILEERAQYYLASRIPLLFWLLCFIGMAWGIFGQFNNQWPWGVAFICYVLIWVVVTVVGRLKNGERWLFDKVQDELRHSEGVVSLRRLKTVTLNRSGTDEGDYISLTLQLYELPPLYLGNDSVYTDTETTWVFYVDIAKRIAALTDAPLVIEDNGLIIHEGLRPGQEEALA